MNKPGKTQFINVFFQYLYTTDKEATAKKVGVNVDITRTVRCYKLNLPTIMECHFAAPSVCIFKYYVFNGGK